MEADSAFYIGKAYDPAQKTILDSEPLNYNPSDLTTHAFVTGMTGSGKTGLCIGLLEEVALHGIPAIVIDPKGDLTNLLLHFPSLTPADFQPWIDADAARRQGKTLAEMAVSTAQRWKDGLEEWDIPPARLADLQQAVEFSVYTPGSDAGRQVSILGSLKAPTIPWEGNKEILREKIASTVTALLTLVGLEDIDPLRSREHILLSNIFEATWSQGKDLDLAELIMQVQTPPFQKLGVFPVESFFPAKDRFDLALLLNNFLAAPAFQTWFEGDPLDIQTLLFAPDGRPRHSVFYLAHLSDTERMFFVTLLISGIETWMRTQSGSSGLRALLYFDEITGYLPPVANPPTKPVFLRLLKQARAFGLGLLLASQNPVDIDYKGLSNAGTWFIGKLQTEQDKQHLLDGLEASSGSLDRAECSRLISGLSQRIFLIHNVHQAEAERVFQSRWTMNYLAGPLTRAQIPALNRLADSQVVPVGSNAPAFSGEPIHSEAAVAAPAVAPAFAGPVQPTDSSKSSGNNANKPLQTGSTTRPAVPSTVAEYFMPNDLTLAQALQAAQVSLSPGAPGPDYLYRPALLAQARVHYLARKYNLDFEKLFVARVKTFERRGTVRWEENACPPLDEKNVRGNFLPQARFAGLEDPLGDAKAMAALQKDFVDWVYHTGQLKLLANQPLKVFAGPETSAEAFHDLCQKAAEAGSSAETAKASAAYDTKITILKTKLANADREVEQRKDDLSQRKREEVGTDVENIIGLFTRSKRRVSSSLTKHRMSDTAKARVDDAVALAANLRDQLSTLEKERQQAVDQINDRWTGLVDQTSEIPLLPQLKDIYVEMFGVIWLPFYVIKAGNSTIELDAFGQ